jgi:carboxymethylenebutenolidase
VALGEIVEFRSNGNVCSGYLARAASPGPAVVVIQEWWGLNDQIKKTCDRFAGEGFNALAPDIYHGDMTTEPDEAMKLMMDMKLERAAKDMQGAVAYLRELDEVKPKKIGSVGFCMGGALSLTLASVEPIDACVTYYGLPSHEIDYANIQCPVIGHFAELDNFAPPSAAEEVFKKLKELGKNAQMIVYPGATHAFFNETTHQEMPQRVGEHKPDAAEESWKTTLEFYRLNLK